jgi:hypothetical protein
VAMTASFRGLPACNTEACGRSRTAYRHLWNTTRDGQYYPTFQQLIDAAEVTRVPLPPRSPNLNAYAKRWVRSVKEEWTERRFSKPDQPRQERCSLGRGCVIQAAGWVGGQRLECVARTEAALADRLRGLSSAEIRAAIR